jgi:transposase InsO family protein
MAECFLGEPPPLHCLVTAPLPGEWSLLAQPQAHEFDINPGPPPQSFREMRRDNDGRPLEDSTDDEAVAARDRQAALVAYLDKTEAGFREDLTPEQATIAFDLVKKFVPSFHSPKDALLPVPGVFHDIELVDGAAPVRQAIRRTHPVQRQVEYDELTKMQAIGVIEQCESAWSSPVMIVPKKNPGEWRFAIDYRLVNKLTKPSAYSLPRLDDALSSMHGATFFTSLDSASAFWTIELSERAKDITAFSSSCGLGQFRFTRMPFGLSNAPASWQRLMDLVFQGLHWKSVLTFLDDVCIFSATFEDHVRDVAEVLSRIQAHGIRLRADKCSFFKRELHYLGHVVSARGVALDHVKTQPLEPMLREPPSSVKQIRTFLGLASYFRSYIKGYATLVEPLTRLTKKDADIRSWGQSQVLAVEQVKTILSSAPILAFPDFTRPFHVCTDASNVGIGAVLSQFDGKLERVICYASRALTEREKKFDPFEKEALGCVWATRKFKSYIFASKFVLHTDHQALKNIFNRAEPPRLARWVIELQGLDFEVVHRRGVNNGPADCLSRMPLPASSELPILPLLFAGDLPGADALPVIEPSTRENIGRLQRDDPFCEPLIAYLESGTLPHDDEKHDRIKALSKQFQWRDSALYRLADLARKTDQLVIPAIMTESVLFQVHGGLLGGHLGVAKTLSILRPRFYWKNMDKSVKRWIASCLCCQRRKRPRPAAGLTQDISVLAPWDMVGLDFCGPYRESVSGNRYILTMTDFFSRWPILVAVPNQSAEVLVEAIMKHLISMHGLPGTFVTDLGKSLTGKMMTRLCKRLGAGAFRTTAYQPTSNGRSERFHGYMGAALTPFVDTYPDDWDQFLHLVEFPYRVAKLTGIGYSPFEMLYGREPTLPVDLLTGTSKADEVELDIDEATYGLHQNRKMRDLYQKFALEDDAYRAKYRLQRDKKRFEVFYDPSDQVLVWTPPRASAYDRTVDVERPADQHLHQFQAKAPFNRKFHFTWTGPHTIVKQSGAVNYHVNVGGKLQNIHVNRLAAYHPWCGDLLAPPQPLPARRPTTFATAETPLTGSLVVIRAGDDSPFWVGKLTDITGGGAYTVQWFGNLGSILLGTYRPSWFTSKSKGKVYHADEPRGRGIPYTNHHDKVELDQRHVVAHAFTLTGAAKLPMAVVHYLSEAADIPWSLPPK